MDDILISILKNNAEHALGLLRASRELTRESNLPRMLGMTEKNHQARHDVLEIAAGVVELAAERQLDEFAIAWLAFRKLEKESSTPPAIAD